MDAGHDATHDAAKDTGTKDVAAKDVEHADAGMDATGTDARDAEVADAVDHDGAKDGAVDAPPDGPKDGSTDAHDAGAPLVTYYFMGRWDTTSQPGYATEPVAEWAGSAVFGTFTGTAIAFDVVETPSSTAASLGGGGYDSLSVVIDKQPPVVFALGAGYPGTACPLPTPQTCVTGENAVQVTTTLAPGQHTIAIYKTTDPFYGGKIQFKQFIPAASGALVKASYAFPHHIEWIGDDLNIGRGVGTEPPACTVMNAETTQMNGASNESLSYAAKVSTDFNAERHNISIGSSGVAASLGGNAKTIPSIYDFVLPDEPTNAWSFTEWSPGVAAPELVVVNLGSYGDFTNCGTGDDCADIGATGTPPVGTTAAAFATAYESFLANLRMIYPSAFILVVSGNGYAGNITPDAASDLVSYVVNQRVAAGEKLTGANPTMGFYTDYMEVDANDFTYTCGVYPDAASQAVLAGTVTPAVGVEGAIHTALGW
jgi:hypothetical protein